MKFGSKKKKTVLTKTGIVYDTVFILVFLWAAAQQFVAPESFVGRWVNGLDWTFLFGLVLAFIGGQIVMLLEKAGYPTTREVAVGEEEQV